MKDLWLLWASGFFCGMGVGIQFHAWRLRRLRAELASIALAQFDALVEEWHAANLREENLPR